MLTPHDSRLFYPSRAKPPAMEGVGIDFLIQTGQVTIEELLVNLLPAGIQTTNGLQQIFEI